MANRAHYGESCDRGSATTQHSCATVGICEGASHVRGLPPRLPQNGCRRRHPHGREDDVPICNTFQTRQDGSDRNRGGGRRHSCRRAPRWPHLPLPGATRGRTTRTRSSSDASPSTECSSTRGPAGHRGCQRRHPCGRTTGYTESVDYVVDTLRPPGGTSSWTTSLHVRAPAPPRAAHAGHGRVRSGTFTGTGYGEVTGNVIPSTSCSTCRATRSPADARPRTSPGSTGRATTTSRSSSAARARSA